MRRTWKRVVRAVSMLSALVLLVGSGCSSSDDDPADGGGEEIGDQASSQGPPPVDETGPELPEVEVTESLTSDVQPGWTIDVRGVVRGPGGLSWLLLDLVREGSRDDWPQGLGSDDIGQGLGALSLIDPVAEVRYRAVANEEGALSAGDQWYPEDGAAMPAFAVFGPLDEETTEVTVDIPTFGTVEGVPVVEWPEGSEPVDDPVRSTMRLRGTDGLRMDVLSVSRVDEVPGTLLRVRMVNESGPDPSTAPFGNPGNGSDVCNIALVDPSSGDYWWKLDPCVATSAQEDLAPGEQATYDVLFPELPDDVGSVVVDGGGYFSSAEVSVDDEAPPTDLELPSDPADPEGGTLVIPEGTPDGGETTTRSGDEVQVELAADVVFDFDSANLTADATSRVEDLASQIADQAAAGRITITGYTDDVGDEAYNQTLSEQRAESVRAVLEPAVGRDDVSFEVAGRGEADPVAPNQINGADNPDGRARNRRVTIVYTAS